VAEFKLNARNVRRGLTELGKKVGGARERKVGAVLKNPLAFVALHARVRLKARGKKFGSFQDFLAWLIEHQDEIFAFIAKIISLFSVVVAIGFVLAMLTLSASAASAAPPAPCIAADLVSRTHSAVVRSQVSAVSRIGVRRAGVPILRRFRR
jgi:hypothetical protein